MNGRLNFCAGYHRTDGGNKGRLILQEKICRQRESTIVLYSDFRLNRYRVLEHRLPRVPSHCRLFLLANFTGIDSYETLRSIGNGSRHAVIDVCSQ